MKSDKTEKQIPRRKCNSEHLLWILCFLLFALSAVLLWNSFCLYRTANEMLRSATAEPPSIVWYEEKETQSVMPATATADVTPTVASANTATYVLNTSSKKIHSPTCRYAETMQETNKQVVTDKSLEVLLAEGYSICSVCNAE